MRSAHFVKTHSHKIKETVFEKFISTRTRKISTNKLQIKIKINTKINYHQDGIIIQTTSLKTARQLRSSKKI